MKQTRSLSEFSCLSEYTDGLLKRNTWIKALIYVSKKKVIVKVKCLFIIVSPLLKGPAISDL